MTGVLRPFLSVLVLFGATFSAIAEEPPALPNNETLARLLSYESRALENHITIGVVVRGEANLSKTFKTQHAIHVSFIWPVNEDGRRVRKTERRVFLWNEEYGWFRHIEGTRRGVAVIDICSEKRGMIEIK